MAVQKVGNDYHHQLLTAFKYYYYSKNNTAGKNKRWLKTQCQANKLKALSALVSAFVLAQLKAHHNQNSGQ